MRLLSDFDGVWTDPRDEGAAQGAELERRILEALPNDRRAAGAAWLQAARRAVQQAPTRYGWAPGGGAISAFGDEDPFIVHSGLIDFLRRRAADDPLAREVVEGLAAGGFADLDALGAETHARGVQREVDRRGPGILPSAAAAGRRLLEAGWDVVVASNSSVEKLERWFDHAGMPHTRHPARAAASLRLRGGAKKFLLGPADGEPLALGDARVEVARPFYAEVFDDERPDAVVGDVFSLDLALPLARRRAAGDGRPRLYWLVYEHTPAWLQERVRAHAPEVEILTGGLEGLANRLVPAASGAPQRPVS